MEEQDTVTSLNGLLIQFAIHNNECGLKRDEIRQQIQDYREALSEKKSYIDKTKKSIEKLEQELSHWEKLAKHYRDNTISLRGTNSLLLQCEQNLQEELQKRQENYSQDVKMYEEKIKSSTEIYQQHKIQYCQSPLAQHLLKLQEENREIEKRISICDEHISAREKEVQALQGFACAPQTLLCESLPTTLCPVEEDLRASQEGVVPKSLKVTSKEEELEVIEDNPEEGEDKMGLTEEQQSPNLEQREKREHTIFKQKWKEEVVMGMEDKDDEPTVSEVPVSTQETAEDIDSFPRTPPTGLKAVSRTPTFSFIGSASTSPARLESPAFTFAMRSAPGTPGSSGFDCRFPTDSGQGETFQFSSSAFMGKKTPESKVTGDAGFLLEQSDCSADEEFEIFFSKSPGPPSSSLPFSFTFGKFQ